MIGKISIQPADALRALDTSLRTLGTWWLREFRDVFPRLSQQRPAGAHSLLIVESGAVVACELNAGLHHRRAEFQKGQLDEAALGRWLAEAGGTREQTRVGLALSEDLFFVRIITLPRAAAHAMQRILEQDLVRRTPFDLDSVWHAGSAVASQASSDVLDVRHWIIRRDRVHGVLRATGLPETAIDFLAVTNKSGDCIASIPIRQQEPAEARWVPRAVQLLCLLVIIVFVAGLGLIGSVQSRTLERMEEELASARQSLGVARSGGLAQFLIRKQSEASIAAVWDELSRILPDDTWLSELRISEGQIAMTGVARDAPGLVRLIAGSRLFEKVNLSGAIVPVPGEGKDQFKISAVVKRSRSDAQRAWLGNPGQ